MSGLYVVGARQRKLLLRGEEEWNLYDKGLILHVESRSGEVRTCVEYESPPEVRASQTSSIVFKSGSLRGNLLYTCTSTEILVFTLPDFKIKNYLSLPCFNDLHHVAPAADGGLFVANTGLDMVLKITPDGKIVETWNVLGSAPWSRFSPQVDYRKIESTKPHESHPNFVFELGDEVWVTRFRQRDAVCLNHSGARIDIAVQQPHDGVVCGEKVYFTTVDGAIVIAGARNLKIQSVIDLKQIGGEQSLLGWCRGILPLADDRFWVGFSRIRKTRFKENVLWVKNVLREGVREKPTHIALYDTRSMQCLREFNLEEHGMNIVFSIFPAPF